MSRKVKILAGIFLLILAASGIAYAGILWKCTTCGMTVKLLDESPPRHDDGECPKSSNRRRRHNWNKVGVFSPRYKFRCSYCEKTVTTGHGNPPDYNGCRSSYDGYHLWNFVSVDY